MKGWRLRPLRTAEPRCSQIAREVADKSGRIDFSLWTVASV